MEDLGLEANSDHYLVNFLFIAGFACWSVVGTVIIEAIKLGTLSFLNFYSITFLLLLMILGIVLLYAGWYTVGRRELENDRI